MISSCANLVSPLMQRLAFSRSSLGIALRKCRSRGSIVSLEWALPHSICYALVAAIGAYSSTFGSNSFLEVDHIEICDETMPDGNTIIERTSNRCSNRSLTNQLPCAFGENSLGSRRVRSRRVILSSEQPASCQSTFP